MIKNGSSIINRDVVAHCAQESSFGEKNLNLDIDWSDFERTTRRKGILSSCHHVENFVLF